MKNITIKLSLLGIAVFAAGYHIGFRTCKRRLSAIVKDEKFMKEIVSDFLDKSDLKDKLDDILVGRSEIKSSMRPELIFPARVDAENLLAGLVDAIVKYGHVTVSDAYGLAGIVSSFKDNHFGWTDLTNASVIRVRTGYKLYLPPASLLH